MNRRTWLGVVAWTAWIAFAADAHAQLGNFLRRGPKIEVVSTAELASMLSERNKVVQQARESGQEPESADFVLVDVRSESEVKVSVLPGAITKSQYETNRAKYQGQLVIPYCTVGGRSGAYAQQLAKRGVKVKNYQGSILDWVKNELPLITLDGKPTNRVHTYSDRYRVPANYEQVTE